MKEKRLIVRYFKLRLYKNRSAAARAVDFAALRLILMGAFYLYFTSILENTVMAAVLSGVALLTTSVAAELYKSIRLERFIIRERKALGERLLRDSLATAPHSEFLCAVREYLSLNAEKYPRDAIVYISRTASPVSEDTALAACRSAKRRGLAYAVVFSASEVSDAALTFAARIEDVKIDFVTSSALIRAGVAERFAPKEGDIDAAILALIQKKAAKRRKKAAAPFEAGRARRYFFVAIGLFALSFFVDYSLYYRLLSAACLSLGAMAWWLNTLSPSSGGAAGQ